MLPIKKAHSVPWLSINKPAPAAAKAKPKPIPEYIEEIASVVLPSPARCWAMDAAAIKSGATPNPANTDSKASCQIELTNGNAKAGGTNKAPNKPNCF